MRPGAGTNTVTQSRAPQEAAHAFALPSKGKPRRARLTGRPMWDVGSKVLKQQRDFGTRMAFY